MIIGTLGPAVIFYFVGSVPFGLLIGRLKGVDLRQHGSGNIGATNARRLLGWRLGLVVLALDFLKGWLPVWLYIYLWAPGAGDLFHDRWTPDHGHWALTMRSLMPFFISGDIFLTDFVGKLRR